ncbi:MAG: NAD-dependent epimerase/dehydratase family protein [Cyclobacteriaceae bacterium]
MSVVIVGGAGFIGRHLVAMLGSKGYDLKIIVKVGTDLEHISNDYSYYPVGLDSRDELSQIIDKGDTIVQLAWNTVPSLNSRGLGYDISENIPDNLSLLEVAREKEVANFIFISSGGTVYGEPQYLPIDEDHPTNPISAYGLSKLMVEKFVQMYGTLHGLKYTILRVSNAYGDHYRVDKPQGVIGHWVESLKRTNSIMLIGEGSNLRDYVHVIDVCEAIEAVIRCEANNGIYNVSTEKGVSLDQILEFLNSFVQNEIKVLRKPSRQYDVSENVLQSQKIADAYGWRAKIDFPIGLKAILARQLKV